jgi:hypothetical protein
MTCSKKTPSRKQLDIVELLAALLRGLPAAAINLYSLFFFSNP